MPLRVLDLGNIDYLPSAGQAPSISPRGYGVKQAPSGQFPQRRQLFLRLFLGLLFLPLWQPIRFHPSTFAAACGAT